VDVAGAVRRPGVYHLKPKARRNDALMAAGGPLSNANLFQINLAPPVEDGEQLYIPALHKHGSNVTIMQNH
jgi:competence protein ComEA